MQPLLELLQIVACMDVLLHENNTIETSVVIGNTFRILL